MSWVAVAIAGGAVVGAVGSNMSARAANKPRNAWTESTSTQNPYMWENLNPRLEDALNLQGSLVDQGAPQVGPDGTIYYSGLPGRGSTSTVTPPGPGVGGSGGGGTDVRGGRKPPKSGGSTWVNNRGETMTIGPGGKAVKVGSGTAAGSKGGGVATPASAEDIFREAASRGFEAGDTKLQDQARTAMGNVLGEAGGGDPENTGFEKYNPILDRLAGQLGSDVESRAGKDLLLGFLGGNRRGGNNNPLPSPTPATPPPPPGEGWSRTSRRAPAPTTPTTTTTVTSTPTLSTPLTPISSGQVPGQVPDTMVPDSYFGTETREIMDESANQAELEDMIRLMNADVERGMYRDLAALDAAAQGSGRFGGDMWSAVSRDARGAALEEMGENAAKVRVGDREARRQARLAALSGVNSRDQALLAAQVQREGIAASERNAASAASAAAAGSAEQAELARRAQDLSAIGALMDYEKFGVGQLSDIGSQLSSDRLNTLGLVPGLEGIGLEGLNVSLGGGGGLADIRANAANNATARAGINVQRQGQQQQLGMFNAGQQQGLVNDYLRTLMGIGGLGGTATTRGLNVQPGAGVSPTGAALTGAVGGASTGAGIATMFPSDASLKSNVTEIGKVGDITLVEWDWVPDNIYGLQGHDFGVIAQDVASVLPDAVSRDAHGYLQVDYAKVGDYLLGVA